MKLKFNCYYCLSPTVEAQNWMWAHTHTGAREDKKISTSSNFKKNKKKIQNIRAFEIEIEIEWWMGMTKRRGVDVVKVNC